MSFISTLDVNFQGDAPEFGDNCFGDQEVPVRYPAGNETWSEDVVASAGTNITLEAHTHDYLSVVVKPTCVKPGYTKHTCTRAQIVTFLYRAMAE